TCRTASRLSVPTTPPTPRLSPLPLHDALPILPDGGAGMLHPGGLQGRAPRRRRDRHPVLRLGPRRTLPPRRRGGLRQRVRGGPQDRKSTRLNSSHVKISYAVFCLKKKTNANKW